MSEDEKPSGGFDGPTTASVIDGLTARTSTQSNIYFDIDDSVAHAGYYSAAFTVAYFDQGSGSFAVHYDNGSADPYKSTASIQLTGTNTWKTATVTASDAYFGGQEHSGADFRLRNGGGQVTVHSVTVKISGDGVPNATDFAPPVTITSPAAGATVTATPAVSGTAEPDATVTVKAEDSTLCTATVADDGTWSCTASAALAAGAHTLTATAGDVTATPAAPATAAVTVQ
nr:Ig-like domain-containing protein [Streptomyces sp. SID4948]